jgi:uncharacterized protein (DUF927 family)
MPEANVDPVTSAIVPPSQPVGGMPDEGSRNQADELDARRQPTLDPDGNPTSERHDHPEHQDNGAPEGGGAAGEPQVDPPEYRSFGDFKMTGDGLVAPVGPKQVRMRVCAPFEVIGRARDPYGNGWGKLIRWTDEDKRLRVHLVPDADLHREMSALTARLADMGLHVTLGCGRPLAEYLSQVEVEQRVTMVSRTGWHKIGGEDCFVLPHRTIGEPKGERVILTDAPTATFEAAGTLDDWRKGIGSLVERHTRLVLMVSTALAGPLLSSMGLEGGGINFHGHSSIGKTTGAKAAASVWGKGSEKDGFIRSWRSTANGLEAAAALHSDTALVLDEIGVLDAREAGSAAYLLANGTSKSRMTRDARLRKPVTWQTVVISTGEHRLADKLAEEGKRQKAGQAVRLLDVPADAGRGFGCFDNGGPTGSAKDIVDAIGKAASTSYGTAGPAFVAATLSTGVDQVASIAREGLAQFRQENLPANADGQVLRACDRFGLAAVAGELAIQFGIVPWPEGTARAAAETCFRDWFAERGGSEPHEVMAAIAQVRRIVEAHGDSRFQRLDATSPDIRPIANRLGYTRGSGTDQQWLVLPETWKSELAAGFNSTFVARALADRGMLLRGEDSFQQVVKIDRRSTRVYALTAAVLSETVDG